MATSSNAAPRRGGAAAALGCFVALAASAAAAAPGVGRYDATLCVSSADQAPNCGPAEVDVRSNGQVRVRVSDIVYRLRIKAGAGTIVVSQGAMQIDAFDAGVEWDGTSLRFADADKQVHYEVQVGAPRRAAK
ncbi:MAG: hypothetical protein ABI809_01000 [Caldimonas sp.]